MIFILCAVLCLREFRPLLQHSFAGLLQGISDGRRFVVHSVPLIPGSLRRFLLPPPHSISRGVTHTHSLIITHRILSNLNLLKPAVAMAATRPCPGTRTYPHAFPCPRRLGKSVRPRIHRTGYLRSGGSSARDNAGLPGCVPGMHDTDLKACLAAHPPPSDSPGRGLQKPGGERLQPVSSCAVLSITSFPLTGLPPALPHRRMDGIGEINGAGTAAGLSSHGETCTHCRQTDPAASRFINSRLSDMCCCHSRI